MNLSTLFGIVSAIAVMTTAILTSSKSIGIFLDFHGILIVFGGTAAAALLCFPVRFYIQIGKVLTNKYLKNHIVKYETVITEIVDLARGYRENPEYFKTKVKNIKNPFLMDALQLIIQGGVSEDTLDEILVKRAQTLTKRYEQDVGVFKTLAKFPPAFGLMGTTLGMITLLQQLGGKDAQKMLGPAMAIGLVATFYGLILANLVFIPISENLTMLNHQDEAIRTIVIDGLRLVRKKEHPKIVEEHLKSYLLPSERAQLKIKI
jgi:chemotaxis protein MotA